MIVGLLGVYEDGLRRGPAVPVDPRTFIKIPSGSDLTVKLRAVTASGGDKVLAGGVLSMTVKRRPSDAPIIQRQGVLVPADGPGRCDFTFVPNDWRQIDPLGNGAHLLYDVWLLQAGEQNALVPASPFLLQPSVQLTVGGVPPVPPVVVGTNAGVYSTAPNDGAVLDVVYLTAPDTVAPADNDDPPKQPVIGFIRQRLDASTVLVQYAGELSGFAGLVSGATYFLGAAPGAITPVAPTVSPSVLQRIGFAKDSSTLVIFVDRDFVVL